jgi:hypothetical protein
MTDAPNMVYRFRLRRTILLTVAVSLLVAAVPAAVAQASPPNAGPYGSYRVSHFAGFVERWDPCAPIPYRTDTRLLNAAGLKLVKAAVGELAEATGMTFVYQGSTLFVPQPGHPTQPDPLIVSFRNAGGQVYGSNYLLGGEELGYGGFLSTYTFDAGRVTSDRITQGYVVIDAPYYRHLSTAVRRSLLLHELGHAVGLGHSTDASQVMYPVVSTQSPTNYAAGDLAGLAAVGIRAGCIRG